MPEWLEALRALKGERSYAMLGRAVNPEAKPGSLLPKGTLSDLFNKGTPSVETLELLLRACQVPRAERAAWQRARQRALGSVDPKAAGLIRVLQADPRRLGVHAAIDAPGAVGELPLYIERDTDTAPGGVRALVSRAAEDRRGGLVLLVGGSSVGKTRCAYEAMRALLGEWWLLHPADAEQVRAIAANPPERLVVWLDELRRYLDDSEPLQAGTVRALLARGAVLVAALWPDHYNTYTAIPKSGQPDPHAAVRELLDLAQVADIGDSFSPVERRRAIQAAEQGDARIKLALQTSDYGLTQTIAAAPQLVRHWKQADSYAYAVLTAAADATRLGVASPIPATLLRHAAPGYCDARQRAKAPPNWFEAALAYLTKELYGAAATLTPAASPDGGMGQIAGYLVADYLQQHAALKRRRAKVPDLCWQALIEYLTDPADQMRVAQAARSRVLNHYAEALYRNANQTGGRYAARELAELLAEQGRVEEALQIWREQADTGDWHAAGELAELLAEQGRVEEALQIWREQADTGDGHAAHRLVEVLAEQGRVEELRERADARNGHAAHRLAEVLAEQGQVEELRTRADAGGQDAACRLVEVLAEQGQVEEALQIWREQVDPVIKDAAHRLVEMLVEQGRAEELREMADPRDRHAACRLAEVLAEQGRVEEALQIWRKRAAAGGRYADKELAELLAEQGRVEELRERAATGNRYADWWLAELLAKLLAEQGRVEEALQIWRERAAAGNGHAAEKLAELLVAQGRVEEALQIWRERAAEDWYAAEKLAELLAEQGRVEELRERAATGDRYAVGRLRGAPRKPRGSKFTYETVILSGE